MRKPSLLELLESKPLRMADEPEAQSAPRLRIEVQSYSTSQRHALTLLILAIGVGVACVFLRHFAA